MKISYDYIINISDMEIWLCSPNEERLACILATDRTLDACFNDLSIFKMTVAETEQSEAYYDMLETMRLIELTDIGYFQITDVQEVDTGNGKSKQITAESYQTVFKRFGIDIENRVYCLYNKTDPTACLRTNTDESFIPSIIGELHDQVGVQLNVQLNDIEPTEKYSEWTITFVDSSLQYSTGGTGTCRTMDENVEYAYDLLVNKVEEAFGCVVVFDYQYKTIKFYSIETVATRKNAYLSYENLLTEMNVTEDSSDIVTVMRCSGDGLDISLVNPTGTGYLVDFSYYMDEVHHKWMSQELIDLLKAWKHEVHEYKVTYRVQVVGYRLSVAAVLKTQAELTTETKILQDLQVARDTYAQAQVANTATSISGSVITGEDVLVGKKSLSSASDYYNQTFETTRTVTAYKVRPVWNSSTGAFAFNSTDRFTGTAQEASDAGYKYFMDGDTRSYCELRYKASVDSETQTATYPIISFYRFVAYKYVYAFIALHDKQAAKLKAEVAQSESDANSHLAQMKEISDALNLPSYFSSHPDEYAELKKYWVEGNYEDPSIAVLDSTPMDEQVNLAIELMETGEQELSKVCQPRFKLSITTANCFASPELSEIAKTLVLGDILTIEKKADELWYYPVLLKIIFNFDDPTQLQLELANSLRLDDWGYTMADLITDASSTSRSVSANWQELMAFKNDRDRLYNLVENPLNSALRAANANMTNQNFAVDTTGILGRVVTGEGDSSETSPEQIRILNNMILFTRDNWETAAAAFGKIEFDDPTNPGSTITAYGLVADALIGRIIVGESMYIANDSNTISLNGSGITIKNSNNNIVFSASTSGDAYISGRVVATTGKIGGWTINETSLSNSGMIPGTTSTYGVFLSAPAPDNISADDYAISVAYVGTTYFAVTYGGKLISKNSDIDGKIVAREGSIGGWNITSSNGINKTAGNYTIAVQAGSTTTDPAFYVKYTNGSTAEDMFRVNNDGSMIANNAVIKGQVTASTLTVSGALHTSYTTNSTTGVKRYTVTAENDLAVNGTTSTSTLSAGTIIGTSRFNVNGSATTASVVVTAKYDGPVDGGASISFTFANVSSYWANSTGATFEFYIISRRNNQYVDDKVTINVPSNPNNFTATYQFSGILYYGLSLNPLTSSSTAPSVSSSVTRTVTQTVASGSSGTFAAITIISGCSIVPEMGNVANLGLSSNKWNDVWCVNVPTSSSARMYKTDIKPFDDRHDAFFDGLIPCQFKFKNGESGRDHYGFVVDEVRTALDKANISTNECAAYVLNNPEEPDGEGSLRYGEFVALNTWEIQRLKARIAELEKLIELR